MKLKNLRCIKIKDFSLKRMNSVEYVSITNQGHKWLIFEPFFLIFLVFFLLFFWTKTHMHTFGFAILLYPSAISHYEDIFFFFYIWLWALISFQWQFDDKNIFDFSLRSFLICTIWFSFTFDFIHSHSIANII